VFVSHDRYFLDGLATKVIEVGNQSATTYLGNYEDYLAKKKTEQETANGVAASAETLQPENSTRGRENGAARERPRRKVNPIRIQQLTEKIDGVEAAIHTHETRIAALAQLLATESLYRDYILFRTTMDEHARLQEELASFMEEWEKLQSELAHMQDANE
jgi:ATP-binding cassette subfamily F protein 3